MPRDAFSSISYSDALQESALPLSITIETHPINTSREYNQHVYSVIHNIARCMHTDTTSTSKLCWHLYSQMSLQGFKRKGHYEIRLPHLVRIVSMKHETTQGELFYTSSETKSFTKKTNQCALAVNPSTGLLTGLYECSLELNLSNPFWRIECTDYDIDTGQWNLRQIIKGVPPGHQTTCNATFTISMMHYTAPLPPEEDSKLGKLQSWLQSSFEQARTEFNRTFKER